MTHSFIVIYADERRELVATQLATHMGDAEPHMVEGVLKAKDDIDLKLVTPTHIVIDIGGRSHEMLEELDVLATSCAANTRVVVTGAMNDIGFYRALIDRGVVEYYPYPADISQIAASLLNAGAGPSKKAANDKKGFAVGFMSAASGDGASTVALNTGYLLANQFDKSVVIVDLDYQFGMIARHLDLKAPYGIRELLEHPERGVDAALLNKMMVPYGRNLQIVAAPAELRRLPNVRSEQIVELLDVLRSQFDYVLFDIQHVWVDWIASLVSRLDHNVVVSQQWLRSLTHVTRIMAAWTDLGISSKHISLVMNRSGSRFKEALSVDDFQRVSGLEIDFYLPNNIKQIVESENQGKTLIELGKSDLEDELKKIAGHIYGLHSGDVVSTEKTSKKKGLFGFIK